MSDDDRIAEIVLITSATTAVAAQYLEQAGGPDNATAQLLKSQKPRKPTELATRRIRGLADLGKSDDESEEDDTNEYYTGGEKSGMVVKSGDGNKSGVDSYFEQLKKAGAQMGKPEDLEQPTGVTAFSGRARKLEDDGSSGNAEARPQEEMSGGSDKPLIHTITFWANQVFTVNDGEPRSMEDPANRAFLEAIGRGAAPPELLPSNPATMVTVNLVRTGSDFQPPIRSMAFTGRGRTLAGDAPSSSRTDGSANPAPQSRASGQSWEGADASQPSTTIQIRLADGSRMVAQFNHSHTIADIRRFIAASRPDLIAQYGLMTAFPSVHLTEDSKTIGEAGLLNAVIIQKL